MTPSGRCLQMIEHHEGCKLAAYPDSVGIYTIGVGSISYESGSPVKKGDKITLERAFQLLHFDLSQKAESVNRMIEKISLKQCQFDSLLSFVYNLGVGALAGSTLLKKVLANPNDSTIAAEFMKWDKDHDPKTKLLVRVKGLTNRRKSEAWLYFHDELKFFS